MKETTASSYHIPVLYTETLDALAIKKDGIYVDATFGGGGHSKGILERLGDNGKLIAFDQDEDARRNVPEDDRLIFIPSNFRHLQRFLRLHKIEKVDGILADLGVSSHQFNEGERGFSIRFNGPMDMRMDTRQTATAADILQSYNELQLHKMFEIYGEVTNAKTLAKHIVEHRSTSSFKTIESFMSSLQSVAKGNPHKYFAQVFQALRIEVNDELGALKDLLQQSVTVLKSSGRIAVITFHSGEDRLVKNFLKNGSFEEEIDDNPFESKEKKKEFLIITKKPVVPTNEEMKENSRSRSAKLRVAEKYRHHASPSSKMEKGNATIKEMAIKKIKASVRQVINYGWVVKNIPFFLFLAGLAVVYIANGHYADKTIRNINATANELKELQYEYKTVKSEMMYKSREAEMVGAAAPLGLKISPQPPMHLIINDNKQQNTEK